MKIGKITAIIAVRKGSERVKDKNIKPFNDTNLLENKIKIFTTRPDTIFGATFLAVSVDHPLCKSLEKQKNFIEFN